MNTQQNTQTERKKKMRTTHFKGDNIDVNPQIVIKKAVGSMNENTRARENEAKVIKQSADNSIDRNEE